MSYFFWRLIPPRPTFPYDIEPAEQEIMGEHAAYWRDLAARGVLVVAGPVADGEGAWGLGVTRAASAEEMEALLAADPAIARGLCTHEVRPMLSAMVGAPEST